MTTLPKTSLLSKPVTGERIPIATISYFRERNRNHAHDLVLKAFREADITQAEIARRLGKRTDVICRLIGAPGNWTLDTVSDLLFAILGKEIDYGLCDPLGDAPANFSTPEWIENENELRRPANNFMTLSVHKNQTFTEIDQI